MDVYVNKDGLQEFATKMHAKQKTIFALKSEMSSPLTVSSAADMTDTQQIYVYVGAESGFTSGDWYYYDGSDWISGGRYMPSNELAVKKVDYRVISGAGDFNHFKGQQDDLDTNMVVYMLAGIQGMANSPLPSQYSLNGSLIVARQATLTNLWVEQTLYLPENIYIRRYTEYNGSGSWTDWIRLATSEDVTNLQNQIDVLSANLLYGRVSFSYTGNNMSIQGTGVIE